jgi:uncharacterized protein YjiS (DUF1127 family)
MLTNGEHALATVARPRRGLAALFTALLESLNAFEERSRQRRALAALDDRLLADIGLDRWTVEADLARPFWKP